jgi:4-hydroxy-4-methyl-2-oxoglutarate aldolase
MDKALQHTIAKLSQLSVCHIADALGQSWPVESTLHPVDPHFRICGPAFTVECAPGDNLTLHHALHLAQSGEVLVVSGSPGCGVALWGELMSMSAQCKGLAGTIIDGPVRDPEEIRALGYPVFCRHFHPRRAAKEMYGQINVPVRIKELSIRPKDFVLGDQNGIVCVPPDRADEVLQLAFEVAGKEKEIKAQILSGRTLFEILNLQQYIVDRENPTPKSS